MWNVFIYCASLCFVHSFDYEGSQKQNFPGPYYFLPAVGFNTVSLVYMYQVSAFLGQNHQRKLAKHAGLDLAVKLLLTWTGIACLKVVKCWRSVKFWRSVKGQFGFSSWRRPQKIPLVEKKGKTHKKSCLLLQNFILRSCNTSSSVKCIYSGCNTMQHRSFLFICARIFR